jgi:hypothetical protein
VAKTQQQPQQPPPPSLAVNAIGEVVSVLSTSLSPLLAYDKLKPLIKVFAVSSTPTIFARALKAALSEVERFPMQRMASVGLAQRNMISTNATRRAAYVISATRRIADQMTEAQSNGGSLEEAISEAISLENTYFRQHIQADAARMTAANSIDMLATEYGDVLGWYSSKDSRTTPECLAANGKNFRASEPPVIGYPGSVHVSCRCHPGPPHRDAEMLSSSAPPIEIAATNEIPSVLEFSQHIANLYQVPLELAMPLKRITKKEAHYRDAIGDTASERCGTCVMYHPSRCDLVEGFIQPNRVCDHWEAKRKSVELVWDTNPNAIKHVRTAGGVAMFHKPIGSPITEAEYQQLLAARKAAKQHPVGHPDRLQAERAVRQARKQRAAAVEQGGEDAHSAIQNEVNELLGKKPAAASTSTTNAAPKSIGNSSPSKSTSTTTSSPVAKSTSGSKSNYASREDDRRSSQGQTTSNFVHPGTGDAMSKSSIGDTYEEIFNRKGAQLLEQKFGGKYQVISHASGGARNTPLDFKLGNKYGGELKTLSINSKNQKTAIKKEEIDRKLAALKDGNLSPLLVVQVVDQSTGEVNVYTHNAFASKTVNTLDKLGSYKYTKQDFSDAYEHAGYGPPKIPSKSSTPISTPAKTSAPEVNTPASSEKKSTPEVKTPAPSEKPTSSDKDSNYQKLLADRLEAKKKYAPGHPERVKAERAVRQARAGRGVEIPHTEPTQAKSTTTTNKELAAETPEQIHKRLEAARASGTPKIADTSHSGLNSETKILTYPDGSKWVSKDTTKELDAGGAEREELASLISNIFGSGAPQIIRDGPKKLIMPFVEGESPLAMWKNVAYDTAEGDKLEKKLEAIFTSPAGKRIGLLDHVIGNADRKQDNIIIKNGKPVPIDHGYSWRMVGHESPDEYRDYGSPFTKSPSGTSKLSASDFTPQELSKWSGELDKLAQSPNLSAKQKENAEYSAQILKRFIARGGV